MHTSTSPSASFSKALSFVLAHGPPLPEDDGSEPPLAATAWAHAVPSMSLMDEMAAITLVRIFPILAVVKKHFQTFIHPKLKKD